MSGIAEPLASLWAYCDGNPVTVTADGDGNWTVDSRASWTSCAAPLSAPVQGDADGDRTSFAWTWPPTPTVEAHTWPDRTNAAFYFEWWTVDSTLTVTVDDVSTPESPDSIFSTTVRDDGWGGYGEAYLAGVRPGDVVTVSDGDITKTLVVTALTIDAAGINTTSSRHGRTRHGPSRVRRRNLGGGRRRC